MIKLINSGCNGHMGRVVTAMVEENDDIEIVAGLDINTEKTAGFPVYSNPAELAFNTDTKFYGADAVIDFSSPKALDGMLEYFVPKSIPLVLCATGYTPGQIAEIEKASKHSPIFRSGNMSVGINLLIDLIQRACAVLGEDFDVEIVERHHRRKVDAPSGTALMLADAAASSLPQKTSYVFERESARKARGSNEIGISSVRGGTIVGVHDVIFAGQDEVIELRHTAASREIFAAGALKAAKYMKGKPPGLYNMQDVLGELT